MKSKKAQAWALDLTIAIMIFIAGILLFYFFTLNNSEETDNMIKSLSYDGNNIGDNLLSEGYPSDWNSLNVIRIGLLSNNKLNETKLQRFFELASTDYQRTKSILNTRNDYFIQFSENITIDNSSLSLLGQKNDSPENLIKVSRLIVYNNKPILFNINIWN